MPLDVDFFQQNKTKGMASAFKDFDDLEDKANSLEERKDERSMQDILREKREKTEQAIKDKGPQVEALEDRKKRLQAQRDILVKQKQEKRERELGEFQEKTATGNKDDLHRELMEIDKRT